jgi:PAS domain S-box-containing protein
MNDVTSHLALLRDPRLAPHATTATPVWLWSTDATQILWANPIGAAIFDAPTPAALAARRFDLHDPAAAQIARLAETLPRDGAGRLERLRGVGISFGRLLLCTCTRISLPDQRPGILVVAMEPAGPALSLAERVARLYAGAEAPLAAFSPDGALLFANAQARDRLGDAASLAAVGAEFIAEDAMTTGRADGATPLGPATIERIGTGATTVLVAMLGTAGSGAEQPALASEAPRQPAEPTAPISAPAAEALASPTPPPSAAPATPAAEDKPALQVEVAIPERRHPLRFVWQMDAAGHFTLGSDEFTELIGPRNATALGRPWREIAAELALDPENQVAHAVATHDTWSGITVSWPAEGSADRLKVELSGLPIYDRNRKFLGYRGFGVCRDVDRIAALAAIRRSSSLFATQSGRSSHSAAEPLSAKALPDGTRDARDESAAHPLASVAETKADADRLPPRAEQPAPNVVPFRSTAATPVTPAEPKAPEPKTPALSPVERNAFRELARQLTARLKGTVTEDAQTAASTKPASEQTAEPAGSTGVPILDVERLLLDRIPVGILVYRLDRLLYANRAFLDWTGYDSLDALAGAGGLDRLFADSGRPGETDGRGTTLAITTRRGDKMPVEGRLFSVPWSGESALALMLTSAGANDRHHAIEPALQRAEAKTRELKSILNTATDGVIVLEADGRIASATRSAEALFGYEADGLTGRGFADLFAPESERVALDYLGEISRDGVRRPITGGREVVGRTRQGRDIPLFMTMGRIADSERGCAVLRDVTPWKKAESDLLAAKQAAEKISAAKSDFLAKISHEIRTPLNSIIGFSEVMIEERFGPIGNERYREYLKDIRTSGGHVVSLLNDLLDLSKIEAGKLDLTFADLDLNNVVQSCVALMHPQATRERIIIRTSLAPGVRPVVADVRSVRQIVLNLLSNSIKFTGTGGQVIVSTAQSNPAEVTLRVRDSGIGMDEKELAVALEPFRQLATSTRWGSAGTGLGLPLTKALAEANHARFAITSKINDGTLVEIAFPTSRAAAE